MHWAEPLSRVLTLKGGERLATLREAAAVILERFSSVRQDASVEHAIELLMKAAETGGMRDRKVATDQLWRVLMDRRLL
jgi:hypothetical protein